MYDGHNPLSYALLLDVSDPLLKRRNAIVLLEVAIDLQGLLAPEIENLTFSNETLCIALLMVVWVRSKIRKSEQRRSGGRRRKNKEEMYFSGDIGLALRLYGKIFIMFMDYAPCSSK